MAPAARPPRLWLLPGLLLAGAVFAGTVAGLNRRWVAAAEGALAVQQARVAARIGSIPPLEGLPALAESAELREALRKSYLEEGDGNLFTNPWWERNSGPQGKSRGEWLAGYRAHAPEFLSLADEVAQLEWGVSSQSSERALSILMAACYFDLLEGRTGAAVERAKLVDAKLARMATVNSFHSARSAEDSRLAATQWWTAAATLVANPQNAAGLREGATVLLGPGIAPPSTQELASGAYRMFHRRTGDWPLGWLDLRAEAAHTRGLADFLETGVPRQSTPARPPWWERQWDLSGDTPANALAAIRMRQYLERERRFAAGILAATLFAAEHGRPAASVAEWPDDALTRIALAPARRGGQPVQIVPGVGVYQPMDGEAFNPTMVSPATRPSQWLHQRARPVPELEPAGAPAPGSGQP